MPALSLALSKAARASRRRIAGNRQLCGGGGSWHASAWYAEAYTRSAGYTDFALVQEDDGRQALSIINHLPNDAHIVLL